MQTQFGIKVLGSRNFQILSNVFLGARQRTWIVTSDQMIDETGVVYICPEYAPDCFNYEIVGNIAAGGHIATYYVFAHECNAQAT
jgi:hypothetical protein